MNTLYAYIERNKVLRCVSFIYAIERKHHTMTQYIRSLIHSSTHPPIPFQFIHRFFFFFYFVLFSIHLYRSRRYRICISSNNSYIFKHAFDTHANLFHCVGQFAHIILSCFMAMSDESRRTYGDGSKLKVRK